VGRCVTSRIWALIWENGRRAAVCKAGLLGIGLGLFVVLIGGAVLLLADKLTGGDGIAGLAAATTAGNAAVVPTIVAQANPVLRPGRAERHRLVASSVVVTAILCPIITVLWARVVLKQPAGGTREAEAVLAADLHPHLDHVPADTGRVCVGRDRASRRPVDHAAGPQPRGGSRRPCGPVSVPRPPAA